MTEPVIVLVRPQLAQNIGMAARAMANFGLGEFRLVAPRDGWPNPSASAAAAGADAILAGASLHPTTRDAVADLAYVLATSARARGQMKAIMRPDSAVAGLRERIARGLKVGILFGPERTGLDNDDVSLADALVSFPADPAFASLNVAQSVLLIAYEWARAEAGSPAQGGEPPPAPRAAVAALFDHIEQELDLAGHYPPGKRPAMTRNLRDMLLRMVPSEQDVSTLHGVVRALSGHRIIRKR